MMKIRNLLQRIAVAVVGIPALSLMIIDGNWFFLLLIDLVIFLCLRELYFLAEKKGFFPSKLTGYVTIIILSWDLHFYNGDHLPFIFFMSIFSVLCIELYNHKTHSLANAAITLFGIIYISLFSSFIMIRQSGFRDLSFTEMGWFVILIFACIWVCDITAFFIGSAYGKRKLFKRVSPNKTWEGAVSGFLASLMTAITLKFIIFPFLLLADVIVIGFIVGIFGQMSDLVQSLFKRDAHVKNSSDILPGHGGIWDRFDSPLFAGPFVYMYMLLVQIFS